MKYLITIMAAVAVLLGIAAPAQAVSVRTVYVVSKLPYPKYKVYYSVLDWNKGPYVNVKMASSCTGKAHCVTIREAELGDVYAGLTRNTTLSNGWTRSDIRIDYRMKTRPYYGRKWIVCHELGHALRVGHTGRGCMLDGKAVLGFPSWSALPGSYNLSKAR